MIGDVIRQAAAMLLATAEAKGIGLEVGLDIRIPFVYADPKRVLQVLTNLIDNAIKFTPDEGSIVIKARLVEADPEFVYISVADTGRGIDPEAKALIFERLYQDPHSIDDSRKGLGLGLYIARELVQLHGGRSVGGKPAIAWQHLHFHLALVFPGQVSLPGNYNARAGARGCLGDHD